MPVVAGVLFVALAVSLGWAVRGEWGSWWGETVPGSFPGMAIWLAFGESNNAWQMIAFGATLAVAHSVGGDISYGKIVSYVVSRDTLFDRQKTDALNRSPIYGLLALFLVGGMIGFFPSTALGLLMSTVQYGMEDLAVWAVLASAGAILAYKLLVDGLGLRLSPPRYDYWAAILGGSVASMIFFAMVPKDLVVLRTSILGWVGYGVGFSFGGLIHRFATRASWRVDSWKWMEHSVGFFGGLALAASAALMGSSIQGIALDEMSKLLVLLVSFWFVPYLILSDVLQDWTFRLWRTGTSMSLDLLAGSKVPSIPDVKSGEWRRITPRRYFALFHALFLVSLLPFLPAAFHLCRAWDGLAWYRLPFMLALVINTSIGIVKFLPIERTRQRLLTQGTFLVLACICLLLLLLF